MSDSSENRRETARRRLSLIGVAIAGALFAIVVVTIVLTLMNRETMPSVTADTLLQSSMRWDAEGPPSYDIEVMLKKHRVERHRVEVRDGEVVRYTLDDHEMTRRRAFDTWSVPGMFGTIEADVENIRLAETGKAKPHTPRLTLWGTFDQKYGIPRRYRRVQWGANFEVSWEVVEFKVVEN